MVQAALTFSLLVTFTTSAAAALCLQMDHTTDSTSVAFEIHASQEMPSAKACCYQQSSALDPATVPQRDLSIEQNALLPAPDSSLMTLDDAQPPPGLFDPVLEKRDHLTPSLAALSISRI